MQWGLQDSQLFPGLPVCEENCVSVVFSCNICEGPLSGAELLLNTGNKNYLVCDNFPLGPLPLSRNVYIVLWFKTLKGWGWSYNGICNSAPWFILIIIKSCWTMLDFVDQTSSVDIFVGPFLQVKS